MNVSIITMDIESSTTAALSQVFRSYHTIISATGMRAALGTQLKIANAVLGASAEGNAPSIKRYIPWQFGIDYDSIGRGSGKPLFDEQLDVRELLRKQRDVEWRIISTGLFTSFLFEKEFDVVDLRGGGEDSKGSENRDENEDGIINNRQSLKPIVRALGDWDVKVSLTTPEDIGRVTAAVIAVDWDEKDPVVYCAGDTVTYSEMADLVEKIVGVKVEREELSIEKLVNGLKNDPGNGILEYQLVFGSGVGTWWPMEKTFNYKNGMKLTSVEEWARENLLK